MTAIHETAALGFERAADVYERARPGYPAEAVGYIVDSLRIDAASTVLDLAAGTGKFTRELAGTGARLVAVEPVGAMRERFSAVLPDVPVLDGTAEAIPLQDGSVDAVTVAQAFHWFDSARAAAEIHRVLKPVGGCAVVWNVRDTSFDWVKRVTEMIDLYDTAKRIPRHRDGGWRAGVEGDGRFRSAGRREFIHGQSMTSEGLVERVASTSFIAALDPNERQRVLDRVRALTVEHPDLRGRRGFDHPYITEVYIFARA